VTRLWAESEAITVTVDSRGWPMAFQWRGRTHEVQHIRQRWQVETDWWADAGAMRREYMAVTTRDHLLCVIYFDLQAQAWRLSKVYD
jgi:hypothetical protein